MVLHPGDAPAEVDFFQHGGDQFLDLKLEVPIRCFGVMNRRGPNDAEAPALCQLNAPSRPCSRAHAGLDKTGMNAGDGYVPSALIFQRLHSCNH